MAENATSSETTPVPKEPIVLPDCARCFWMKMRGPAEESEGGHCYMFRDPPTADCVKFSVDGKPPSAFEMNMRMLDLFGMTHDQMMGRCVRCSGLGCPSCRGR